MNEKLDFKKIAHELNTQDNRITADPLFCVFEKERIYGLSSEHTDKWEWYRASDSCSCEENDMCECKDEECKKVYYVERDRFVNAHFTEKAANEHIRINGHNLKEPFTYVTSLWRCPEMIAVRNFLKENK